METTLMIVTIVALALALGMSGVAWRLLREHRQRTDARVRALQELADDMDFDAGPEVRKSGGPQVSAPVLDAWDLGLHDLAEENPGTPEPQHRRTARRHLEIGFGATVAAPAAPKRRWLALAAVGVVMAGIVFVIYAVYRPAVIAAPGEAAPAPAARGGVARPIELLSLRHQMTGDGTFTITGLVQNPLDGVAVRNVMAVVYLFDREGHYFASGKASLDFTPLQPGDESPFVVRIPNVTRVSRYRVGFRSEEGGIVAHVDRRGQLPGGTTGDAVGVPAQAVRRSE